MSSTLIKRGRVVTTADDYVADILIKDGLIALIGLDLSHDADNTIDATGKYVLPGCIDPHTHVQTLSIGFGPDMVSADDFVTTTISGAFGGTTTMIHFCFQGRGESLLAALDRDRAKLEETGIFIDVGFHLVITDLGNSQLKELDRVVASGVTSYKLFMANPPLMVDDAALFKSMQAAAALGALVLVHAENGQVIDVLTRQAVAAGNTEPKWHALTRPILAEAEATGRAIQLARIADAPLYVVHVSSGAAADAIGAARERGWKTFGETCTHYLFIDETYLERPNFEGAKYVCSPPPRPKVNQDMLWQALADDVLSVVSSDCVPFTWNRHKALGKSDFSKIPAGVPGIEDRLLMLHHFGVGAGRLSLHRLVELLSTNPAKIFGLYPRKGTISVGSDADLVIFNPDKRTVLSQQSQHTNADYNLYEGTEVVGAPDVVLVRGEVVVNGRELAASAHGEFIERAPFGEELARTRPITSR